MEMSKVKYCTSCKKEISDEKGAVEFPCPNCNEVMIIRCEHCRSVAAKYVCHKCGFEGP